MKKYHSFGKRALPTLLITILIGTTLGCPDDSAEDEPSLQSIAVTSPPTKTVYVKGETLDISGLVVTGTYSGGMTKVETVNLSDISGYNKDTTETQTLTVTVGGKTATFTVTVNNTALQSIAITSPPTKTVYAQGEALDLSGIVVTGTYAGGTTKVETVTLANISGYNKDTTGQQTVTVTINGETATFIVTVNNTSAPPIGLDDLASAAGGNTADNPVLVTVQSRLTKGGWATILSTIAAADKYVSLDLSACTMTDAEFDPAASTTGAEKITALILPDTAESIKAGTYDNSTFKAFTALTSISGTGVETVGDYAFRGCTGLTAVSLPVATTIGNSAFSGCTGLPEVSLPVAQTIGYSAFYDCTSLASVSLPVAQTVNGSAFSGCMGLSEVSLPVAQIIGASAFSRCTSLTEVSLPVATTSGGFSRCTSLTEVSLPMATIIYEGTFYGCTSLAEVNLPMAQTIGSTVFSYCTSLTEVSLPMAQTIGYSAFSDCTSLTEVSLSVATSIEQYAFWYCTSLESVSLPVATAIGNDAFYRCTSLTAVSLPVAMTIGDYTFSGCTSLTEVSLPAVITLAANGHYGRAFSDCTSLTSVSLPVVETIGHYAFSSCTSLTEVYLPMAQTIRWSAFSGCTSLTTITVDPANTAFTAHDGMLLNKAETTLIAYPSASGDITLPSVIAVGSSVFYKCENLTSVSLPAAQTIGATVFSDCTSLTSVSLPATPPSISTGYDHSMGYDNGIFSYTGSSGRITIRVPAGVVFAYTSEWGVSASTSAGGNSSKYGYAHKAVIITDVAQ
jgi:hypothetical protein